MAQQRSIILAAACVACFAATGCYNQKEVEAFLQQPRAPISGKEYRILPPDVIKVTSRHVPEIDNQIQQVRPDGKVNLPLVGEIAVAGKTPKEVEYLVDEAAGIFYEEVDSTVTVSAYNSQKYFVFGQVAKAGSIPWTGHDSLLDALATAQPTYLAWPERIIIVRGNKPEEGGSASSQPIDKKYKKTGIHEKDPDNPSHTMTINLMAMIKKGDMANNVYLLPNDVVYVQPNPFAKIGLALQSILFPVRPVLEAARVPSTIDQAAP